MGCNTAGSRMHRMIGGVRGRGRKFSSPDKWKLVDTRVNNQASNFQSTDHTSHKTNKPGVWSLRLLWSKWPCPVHSGSTCQGVNGLPGPQHSYGSCNNHWYLYFRNIKFTWCLLIAESPQICASEHCSCVTMQQCMLTPVRGEINLYKFGNVNRSFFS